MRLLVTFIRAYPLQSAITLASLLIAGLVEGFGLTLLLPLLAIAAGENTTMTAAEGSNSGSALNQMVAEIFETVGITPTIGGLLIIFAICMILKAFLMLSVNKRVGYMVAQVATDLRLELIHALFVSRWEYFIRQPVGTLTNSLATEAGRSAGAFLGGIRILAAALHAIVYGTIVFLVSWKATLVALAAGLVILVLFRHFIQKSKRAGARQTKLLQSLIAVMTDSLLMIKPLKTMAREHLADAVLEKKTEGLKKAIKKQVFASKALSAFQEPVTVIFLAAGLYGVLVIWKLPLASVLVMVYMLSKLMKKLQKIQSLYQSVVADESAYWSLQAKVQAAKQTKEVTLGTQKVSLNRSIRLDRVSFAYGERWILENVDFDFPVGSYTAIVGSSGVGKTTLVDLVTGLLQPQKGEIWIDDIPMSEIDLGHWRRMIGYVPQDTLLLHDTVFVNVTLGDKALTDKDVEYALRSAGAWNFVQTLPKGMYNMVGERGHKLSGGQRQRIAIARALVHKPQLLILDEATTALDPKNEAAICETLSQLRGELTILAISHQPAVLDVADRAYRLESGKAFLVTDRITEGAEEKDASTAFVQAFSQSRST
jgi:ATP-binding cassette subfamily C protein